MRHVQLSCREFQTNFRQRRFVISLRPCLFPLHLHHGIPFDMPNQHVSRIFLTGADDRAGNTWIFPTAVTCFYNDDLRFKKALINSTHPSQRSRWKNLRLEKSRIFLFVCNLMHLRAGLGPGVGLVFLGLSRARFVFSFAGLGLA